MPVYVISSIPESDIFQFGIYRGPGNCYNYKTISVTNLVLLATIFCFSPDHVPKDAFGHEADRQGRYRRKNTDKFDSATRIQRKTSRTRIRPTKIELDFT